TTDGNGLVQTNYKGNLLQAILDTGSNGYFFPDNVLQTQTCAAPLDSFYCPPNPVNLMGTLIGFTGGQVAVPFQVANFQSLFQSNNAAFNNVGGVSGGMPIFDWGLPLFFGRTVVVGIEGQQSPLGIGPYFAL
ncbi:MAG TPA: DUF3443 family protein, partial [Nitrospira sp.]|nr:DUF3443 family protein [Nitrospira sp.]